MVNVKNKHLKNLCNNQIDKTWFSNNKVLQHKQGKIKNQTMVLWTLVVVLIIPP